MAEYGRSLPEVKRLNRVRIKEYIYKNAPVTRVEVAKALHLTLPTITTSVAAMLSEGILTEEPMAEDTACSTQYGRRPLMLRFTPSAAYAAGVELGPYQTTLCVTDLCGNIAAQRTYPPADSNYDVMLQNLRDQLLQLLTNVPTNKLQGIGIGLPGFIKSEKGIIRSNPRPTWAQRPFAADLCALTGSPVIIDNNVRMRAAGEELFATKWRPHSFAYYYISKGIACPIIMKNSVMQGYTAGAGEIGHTIVDPSGPKCSICGNHGCLDAIASESAVLRSCMAAHNAGEAPILTQLLNQGEAANIQTILLAQEAGDRAVSDILHHAVRILGVSLANMVNLIGPGLVLVDGYLLKIEENRKLLSDTANQYFYGLNEEEVKLEFLPFDPMRGARGSAAHILRKLFLER